MVPSQTTLEDGELVDRADTVAAAGEFQADWILVGDVRKAEQLVADPDLVRKVSTVFGLNVVDERAALNVVVFSEH